MQLIKNNQIVEDSWQYATEHTDIANLPDGDIIISLSLWSLYKDDLLARSGKLGLSLTNDCDLTAVERDLGYFDVITLPFPAFRDGRSYSIARTVRQHHSYKGELRATGNVLRDQVEFMARVGFDAFEIDPKQDTEDALNAFGEFSVKYQASSDEPLPLFKRQA